MGKSWVVERTGDEFELVAAICDPARLTTDPDHKHPHPVPTPCEEEE